MDRAAFKKHVESALEDAVRNAESKLGVQLPRRYAFSWFPSTDEPVPHDRVVEEIMRRVYVDESHIYPCVDLGPVQILEDGALLLVGKRTGYQPCEFQRNWSGREGPFVLFYSDTLGGRVA